MPVADQRGHLGGSSATPASSAAGVPGIPPGTPVTKSTCTLPPNGSPYVSSSRAQRRDVARGRTARTPAPPPAPAPAGRASTMNGQGLRKTSSPKFVVPQVSEHESGSASSTVSRWSSGSCTLPPVDSWTTREVCSRSASTAAAQQPGSSVGAVLAVADVQVDHRRAGGLAAHRGLDELVEGGRQLRDVGLGRLGAGGRDGDEGAGVTEPRRAMADIMAAAPATAWPTGRRRPPGSRAMPPTRAPRVDRGVALDQRERDRASARGAGPPT